MYFVKDKAKHCLVGFKCYTFKKMQHFPTTEKLHTDVLEEKYGSIHSKILRHDTVREALLLDTNNILRTYALTFLVYDKENKEIAKIDGEIKKGGLIGKTFREYGYVVKKNVIDVFLIPIPEWMKNDFQTNSDRAKARISEFYAKKEGYTPLVYGKVLEIYSPDFRDPKDGINSIDTDQVNPVTTALVDAGIPIDEVWQRLDRATEKNEWDDVKDKFDLAVRNSIPIVAELHQKIDTYLLSK